MRSTLFCVILSAALFFSFTYAQDKAPENKRSKYVEQQEKSLIDFYSQLKTEIQQNREIDAEYKKKLLKQFSPENFLTVEFEKIPDFKYKNQATLDTLTTIKKKLQPELNLIHELHQNEIKKIESEPLKIEPKNLAAFRARKTAEAERNYKANLAALIKTIRNSLNTEKSLDNSFRKKYRKELQPESFTDTNLNSWDELKDPKYQTAAQKLNALQLTAQKQKKEIEAAYQSEKSAAQIMDPRIDAQNQKYQKALSTFYRKTAFTIAAEKTLDPAIKKSFAKDIPVSSFFSQDFTLLLPDLKTIPDLKISGDQKIKRNLDVILRIQNKYKPELQSIQENYRAKREKILQKLDKNINNDLLDAKEEEIERYIEEIESKLTLKDLKAMKEVPLVYKTLWTNKILASDLKELEKTPQSKKYYEQLKAIQSQYRKESEEIWKIYRDLSDEDIRSIINAIDETNKKMEVMLDLFNKKLTLEINREKELNPYRKKFAKEFSAENFMYVNFEALPEFKDIPDLKDKRDEKIQETMAAALTIQTKYQMEYKSLEDQLKNEKSKEKDLKKLKDIDKKFAKSFADFYKKLRTELNQSKELDRTLKNQLRKEFQAENFMQVDFQAHPGLKFKNQKIRDAIAQIKKKFHPDFQKILDGFQKERLALSFIKIKEQEIDKKYQKIYADFFAKMKIDLIKINFIDNLTKRKLEKELKPENFLLTDFSKLPDFQYKLPKVITALSQLQEKFKLELSKAESAAASEKSKLSDPKKLSDAEKRFAKILAGIYKKMETEILRDKYLDSNGKKKLLKEYPNEQFLKTDFKDKAALFIDPKDPADKKVKNALEQITVLQNKFLPQYNQIKEKHAQEKMAIITDDAVYNKRVEELDKKFQDLLLAFYGKLKEEIQNEPNIDSATKKKYPKEFLPENFLKVDFANISDFRFKNRKNIEALTAIQKKYQTDFNDLKEIFFKDKERLRAEPLNMDPKKLADFQKRKLAEADRAYKGVLAVFYKKLREELAQDKSIDPAIRRKYRKELQPDLLLLTDFDKIPEFTGPQFKKSLEAITAIKEKNDPQFKKIELDYKQNQDQVKLMDPRLDELEQKYAKNQKDIFAKFERELALNREIEASIKRKIAKEFAKEKFFLIADFKEALPELKNIPDLKDPADKKLKPLLDAVLAIQAKYSAQFKNIEDNFKKEKEDLAAKREAELKQRVAYYIDKLRDIEQDEIKAAIRRKKEEKFWYNFALGIKGGVNFSTGSNSKSSEAAPGLGLSFEYTTFRIRPIAFESSIEFNVNYIQKPVTFDAGTVNADYINLPIFIKGKWPAHIPLGLGDLSPFIGIGIDPYFLASSNFHSSENNQNYYYNAKKFNLGFVWNLGGELNILDIGVVSIEFRMSIGTGTSFGGETLDFTSVPGIGHTVTIPQQKQNGYMVFLGYKMFLGTFLDLFD